jgi:hypothetical protein
VRVFLQRLQATAGVVDHHRHAGQASQPQIADERQQFPHLRHRLLVWILIPVLAWNGAGVDVALDPRLVVVHVEPLVHIPWQKLSIS